MAAQPKKEPKRKPKYGMFSCVGYVYGLLWKYERWLAFTGILIIPVSLLLSALTLYTPSLILNALETSDRFSQISLVIIGLMLAGMLAEIADLMIRERILSSEFFMQMRFHYIFYQKKWYRDYYHGYQEYIRALDERAYHACEDNHTDGVHFPMDFAQMAASLLKFVLFGAIVSALHPLFVLLLIAGCLIQYLMNARVRKVNWETQDTRNALLKKAGYFCLENKGQDFRHGKDIRLYSMRDFLKQLLHSLLADYRGESNKVERRGYAADAVGFLIVLFRDGLAYAFLLARAAAGEMDASSFVLYFSAITSLSGLLNDILKTWGNISEGAMQISDFREYLDVEDRLNHGPGLPVPSGPFSIEFQNVTFKYPQGTQNVLENVSFKIEPGEKIALVGLNGAGKTTLTLLMCGMLLPDAGTILLDGQPVTAYNRDEMYGLFGLVPQNYNLLPISISCNIACAVTEDEIDEEKLWRCIELAGLTDKIRSLPLGTKTPLDRELNPDGISLSGGETQKLLLARLLYKNPPCIILDEPTAALDPIAEHRMYCQYNEIAAHATSVFISHRLASTRFCDRIFLLDGANFAEVGTHEELMAANGKYRHLFDVQSKYYQEGVNPHEAAE